MNEPESNRIRVAESKDQGSIHSLLLGFELPLVGLDNTKLWVLESPEGTILGVAGLEIYSTQGLLRSVAISKETQRQGNGVLLVNHVLAEVKKSNVEALFLLTTTAPAFFKKLGFKEQSREKVIGDITESVEFKSACPKTAVLMSLKIR